MKKALRNTVMGPSPQRETCGVNQMAEIGIPLMSFAISIDGENLDID
jgi:hypothetical protein